MKIYGKGNTTYLFLNGISIDREMQLAEQIVLLPAKCAPAPDDIIAASRNEVDLGIATIFLRQVSSQLRITDPDPKILGMRAWNAVWDAILLSAFADCEAVCNFQSDRPAEEFDRKTRLSVTNYHLRGLTQKVHKLSTNEIDWLSANFSTARDLLAKQEFRTGIHALWSYRWHGMAEARLALLWAGIESLFRVESEIVFRISLYAARFLNPDDDSARRKTFDQVRALYKQRSAAVHGGKIKGDTAVAVDDSAKLLRQLLVRCVETRAIPDASQLAP